MQDCKNSRVLTIKCLAVKPPAAGATKIGDPRQQKNGSTVFAEEIYHQIFVRSPEASSQGHPPTAAAPPALVLGDGQ